MNTVQSLINLAYKKSPEKIFLHYPEIDQQVSFAELYQDCLHINEQFKQLRLKKGDKIGFLLENGIASSELFFSVMYGGYVIAPLNLIAQMSNWEYVIQHSELKILFYSPQFNEEVDILKKQFSDTVKFVKQDKNSKPFGNIRSKNPSVEHDVTTDDDALLMYTSGTTGQPKGVLLTNKNIIAGGTNVNIAHQIQDNDSTLCVLPFYHINAQMVSLMSSLVARNPIVIPNKFSVNEFWELIAKYRCTWFSVVPTIISYLIHKSKKTVKTDFLRFGRSASASLPPELHHKFEAIFGVSIVETMGLTETAAQILSNPIEKENRKYGSVGLSYGNKAKIVDSNFQVCPPDEEGEIVIQGDNVMKCYYKNEEESKKTIINGWLKTGDLGKMDKDGFIFVTGRIKELIIKGGENISPREIDDVLYSHDDIIEAAAFAVEDEHYGQNIEAAIVSNVEETDMQEIKEYCIAQLGKFKAPQKIHQFETLPKGPSGKIQRNKIKSMLVN